MVDAQGGVSAHTGNRAIPAAGHLLGANFSVQANLMANDGVWPAMARAFESAKGDLAERLLAALDAAQQAGGDIRGKQSAAMVVVTGKPTGDVSRDRLVDLRVDDNVDPLGELRRLLTLKRAYDHVDAGRTAQRNNENERALAEFRAASSLAPDDVEIVFVHAVALVRMGRVDDALPLFRSVFSRDRAWCRAACETGQRGIHAERPCDPGADRNCCEVKERLTRSSGDPSVPKG